MAQFSETWREQAECRKQKVPTTLFYEGVEVSAPNRLKNIAFIKDLCHSCGVAVECVVTSMENGDQEGRHGNLTSNTKRAVMGLPHKKVGARTINSLNPGLLEWWKNQPSWALLNNNEFKARGINQSGSYVVPASKEVVEYYQAKADRLNVSRRMMAGSIIDEGLFRISEMPESKRPKYKPQVRADDHGGSRLKVVLTPESITTLNSLVAGNGVFKHTILHEIVMDHYKQEHGSII